jgi:hypothetical protein
MAELASKNAAEIQDVMAKLLGDLERPTAADEVVAEVVASAMIRSRRKRERGRDDRLERQQISTMLHNFPSLRTEQRPEL